MSGFTIDTRVYEQLEDIYDYTRDAWGDDEAISYVASLFEAFGKIADRCVSWRRIGIELGVDGYRYRPRGHVIYWRGHIDRDVRIVAVLHQRMQPRDRLRAAFDDADDDQAQPSST